MSIFRCVNLKMEGIYLPVYGDEGDSYKIPIESGVVIFITQFVSTENVGCDLESNTEVECVSPLYFYLVDVSSDNDVGSKVPKTAFGRNIVRHLRNEHVPEYIQQCMLPSVITQNGKLCITGLCNVLRWILKLSPNKKPRELLGFRQGCLMACAESSVWTQFCEVDLINTTKQFYNSLISLNASSIPIDVVRLEFHLSEPIRTHNIGKKQHELAKEVRRSQRLNNDNSSYQKSTQLGSLSKIAPKLLPHAYAEDVTMTLADLMIYFFIRHILHRLQVTWTVLKEKLPFVTKWYDRMTSHCDVSNATKMCQLPDIMATCASDNPEHFPIVSFPVVEHQSLYISQPKKCSRPRIYTKQMDIDGVVNKLKMLRIEATYMATPHFLDSPLQWSEMPDFIQPTYGNLPESRLHRKCQQLENMALSICQFAQDGDVIVDFCSGGGHLGILLAYLLPKCKLILVENKEESVNRALMRSRYLNNISIYQCNLDYFKGNFDFGIGLHACGVATDLIIERCLEVKASFVVCSCCYGSMKNTQHISYPRSKDFLDAGISSKEYYFLGHAADQTHEKGHKTHQGKYCMGLVDLDRGLKAKAEGYHVKLFTMNPSCCTPKNNVIIGISAQRCQDHYDESEWL